MPESEVDRTAIGRPVGHFKLLAYAIGGLCLATLALLAPIPFHGRGIAAAGDLVHAPLFGGLALGVLTVSNRLWPLQRVSVAMAKRCLTVAVVVFAFGVLIEIVQFISGRQGNAPDAINNGLGIISATLLYWGWQLQRSRLQSRSISRAFFMTAGIIVAMAWWNPIMIMLDARSVYSDFPSLATFESTVQFSRFYSRECELGLSRLNATQGKQSMEVSYQPTDNPATTLVELQHDWTGLSTLEIDATLDVNFSGASVEFMIQVIDEPRQDKQTETYRGQWTLEPGKTKHIRITREEILNGPDSSEIDLTKIKYVDLMLIRPAAPAKVRFDDLRLTLDPS